MGIITAILLACAAEQEKDAAPGLVAEYFAFDGIRDFPTITEKMKPVVARVEKVVRTADTSGGFNGTPLRDNFYVRWTGTLRIPSDGTWTFRLTSDDGSRLLWIGGKKVVDNGGLHGMQPKSATASLKKGDPAGSG